jgi:cytolysin (calcineurin-like family phosphatase)
LNGIKKLNFKRFINGKKMNEKKIQNYLSKLIKLFMIIFAFLLFQSSTKAQTGLEQQCFDAVQGKVAWELGGNKNWSEANIRALCKGTNNPAQTINCFSTKISAGVNWSEATSACSTNDFYMIIAADPQYPRFKGDSDKQTESTTVNKRQVANIKALINQLGSDKVKGIIINGDLTEYGGANDLSNFKELWSKEKLGSSLIYPGLGNHDYVNNLGGCSPDCTNRMLGYMKDLLEKKEVKITTYDPDSLAYSWDFSNVHFIQLHNHPATVANTGTYNIKPSMKWFEEDLKKARTAGKVIIVNLHDYGDTFYGNSEDQFNEFNDLLRKYKVSAVFAGHLHDEIGKVDTVGNTNIFRSGSPMFDNYLLVHFKDNKIKVEKVTSQTETPSRTAINDYDLDTSNQADNSISIPDRSKTTTYKVRIKTGKDGVGGTDANIYISFTGPNGQTEEYLLDKSGYNDFEAGDDDEYTLNNVLDVGTIKAFKIRSDLSGPGYAWLLEKVTITKGSDIYESTVNWVMEKDDGSKYPVFKPSTVMKKYTFKIYTGTLSGAGTDSNISLKLCRNTNDCTSEYRLNAYINGNAFENGSVDTVEIVTADVGNNPLIKIKSDTKYSGSGWYLAKIELSGGGVNKTFTVNSWIEDTTEREYR